MTLIREICLVAAVILFFFPLIFSYFKHGKFFFPVSPLFLSFFGGISFLGLIEKLPEIIPGIENPKLLGAVVGFLFTQSLGHLIPIFKEYIKIERPAYVAEETWEVLFRTDSSKRGGAWIGFFERTLYFIAFIFEPLFIGGLLTFKIAAKWEAWKNIVKVPEKNPGICTNNSDFFLLRFKLGGYFMSSFVIGTFSNILFALIGYGFYKWVPKVLHP